MSKTTSINGRRKPVRYSTSQIASVCIAAIAATYLGMRLVSLVRLFWF